MAGVLVVMPPVLAAQGHAPSAADSALVGRVLLAEDRRDSTDAAITAAARHPDERLRVLARRALGRIRDARFAERDALPPLAAPRAWPEPEWRLRMRALAAQRNDCAALLAGMQDQHPHLRLRAMGLAGPSCAGDDAIAAFLHDAIDRMPSDVTRRAAGHTSWHDAAHALVALARLRPTEARERMPRLAAHGTWQVRQYAARAAAALSDTSQLRILARDAHDNVRETAIGSLSRLVSHDADDIYVEALQAEGVPVVRVAAVALKDSPRPDVAAAAMRAFERVAARDDASAHDTRTALLETAGRPVTDDRPPTERYTLPPDAIALALGADIRLRVTMAERSGRRSFVVRLRGDVAPMMGARVLQLVREGWYEGLDWHRVESDFVIQGLGPASNEYVGYPRSLRDELGTVPHARGTLGMSTRGHDTGDGQWFVNLRDNLRLGRDYTVWAEIVEGIDVVDAVLEGDVVERIAVIR